MSNENLAFGIDLSKWNTSPDGKHKPDFDAIAAHSPEVVFIAMRAGISWGYQDPWFSYYMAEAQRIKRVCLAYHVLFPGQPAAAQMDNFFRILGDIDFNKVPLVLDLELDHGQTVSTITQTTANSINIITKRTGKVPFIYSRAGWVNQYLKVSALPPVFWWLAQYRYSLPYPLYTPEYDCPPTLPAGVYSWAVHQTAMRGKSIGAKAMHYMDYNRWNGTKADVLKFIGEIPSKPIICPIDYKPCCRLVRTPSAAAVRLGQETQAQVKGKNLMLKRSVIPEAKRSGTNRR
jgi:GH25 family lysozyme M1 (1,4-beta-N-acetylmuramidase)